MTCENILRQTHTVHTWQKSWKICSIVIVRGEFCNEVTFEKFHRQRRLQDFDQDFVTMYLVRLSRVFDGDISGKFSRDCSLIISLDKFSRDVTFGKCHQLTRDKGLPPHRPRSRNSQKSFLLWFYSVNLLAMWLSRNVTGKYTIKAFHRIVYVAERAGLCVTWLIHSCVTSLIHSYV